MESKKMNNDYYFHEQFRMLRAKIGHLAEKTNFKIVAVTSAIAGEGKSLCAINLAKSFAATSKQKILLIDADLRKAEMAGRLGIPPVPGLGEFLRGSASANDILRNSSTRGFHVIPAGTRTVDPGDVLGGNVLGKLLGNLRDHFHLVILDTPPILPVADTLSLRNLVDGFLLIFRVDFTPYHLFRQAFEEVGEEKVFGVVLNGIQPKSQKYYHRYYGSYYQKVGREEPGK